MFASIALMKVKARRIKTKIRSYSYYNKPWNAKSGY